MILILTGNDNNSHSHLAFDNDSHSHLAFDNDSHSHLANLVHMHIHIRFAYRYTYSARYASLADCYRMFQFTL